MVYMGSANYYYDGTTRGQGYGAEFLRLSNEYYFTSPFQNRYLKLAAIEPNTTIRVYFNGTNVGWRTRSLNAYGSTVNIINEGPNNTKIVLYTIDSWIDIPIPRNTAVYVKADKPVLAKILYGWTGVFNWRGISYYGNYYPSPEPNIYTYVLGYEDIALFILGASTPIINIDPIVYGPLYAKVKVNWEIRDSVVVEDLFEFWANSTYFKVHRTIYTPTYVSYTGHYTFINAKMTNTFSPEFLELWLNGTTKTQYNPAKWNYAGSSLAEALFLAYSSLEGIGIGITNLVAYGSSTVGTGYITGYYNYDEDTYRFVTTSTDNFYLAGSTDNKIDLNFIVVAGSLGYSTNTTAVNDYKSATNAVMVTKGNLESTAIDVSIRVYDYDMKPLQGVKLTLSSDLQGYNATLITDTSGTVVFPDVPASTDYTLKLFWTNTSSIFTKFPNATETYTSLTISSDTLLEFKVAVRDMEFQIYNKDMEPFPYSMVSLYAYYYPLGANNPGILVVNSTQFNATNPTVRLSNMPLGRIEKYLGTTDINFLKYTVKFNYTSIYGIKTSNSTEFLWEKGNTTKQFTIVMPVSTLYVRVLDLNNVTIPGSNVVIYYDNRNYTRVANLTGIATFDNLPLGTYVVNAFYYGKNATNTTVNLTGKTIINITLPLSYGVKPTEIILSSEYLSGYWGSKIVLYAQLLDSDSGTPIQGNLTFYLIDPVTNEIIIQDIMTDVSGNTSEPNYAYEIDLSILRAGKIYNIHVVGFAENYAPPSPQNATLYVQPIDMVITYKERIDVYWGRNVEIAINVTHTIEFYGTPITGAKVDAIISREFTTIETFTMTEQPADSGVYKATVYIDSKYDIGFYSIVINIGKYGYQNATITIQLQVKRAPTVLIPNTTSVEVIYGEYVRLSVAYNRTDTPEEGISTANATYVILDLNYQQLLPTAGYYTMTNEGNGRYSLKFNSSIVDIGVYIVRISLGSKYHENKTVDITLKIVAIPTISVASKLSDTLEWGENFTVTVLYNKTVNGITQPIVADNAYYEVKYNATTVLTGVMKLVKKGVYRLEFNTTELTSGLGAYIITVHLEKAHFEAKTITIQLTVTPAKVNAYAQPANITVVWGEGSESQIIYNRHRDGAQISADSISLDLYDITNNNDVNETAVSIESTLTGYVVKINSSLLSPGDAGILYKLTIILSRSNYETAVVEIYIKVMPREINLNVFPNTVEAVWGDKVNITMVAKDLFNNRGVDDLNIELVGDESVKDATTIIKAGNGTYILSIDTSLINKTQEYIMHVKASKINYKQAEGSFRITISPVEIEVKVNGANQVQLNPITGGSTTYEAGIFDKSRGGIPVSTANVELQVLKGGQIIYQTEMKPIENRPGYYSATIVWNNMPNFTPGDTYQISVSITSLQVKGVNVPTSKIQITTTGTTSTTVDYLGGHTEVPGLGRAPTLIVYPIAAVIMILAGVVGYKVILYMRLPEEVKEIDRLIKLIEKGKLEYEVASRDEQIRSLLEEEL